jgi:hypothetical protein
MYPPRIRSTVRDLLATGGTVAQISAGTGVSRSTIARWRSARLPTDLKPPPQCMLCGGEAPGASEAPYAYLLGQYLGDGRLVTRTKVPVLRIYCCTDYPGITGEVVRSVDTIRGSRAGIVRSRATSRMITVQSYWNHWPCVFPQHGPGRKHERPIVLAGWQRELVDRHPWPLIRGLIHSDGCRAINRVTVRGAWYSYPRYFFGNESRDILQIMADALDRVGVAWRYNRPNSISIARRAAVAAMDAHVGAKY